MRLLNTISLRMVEFQPGDVVPRYAIFSHRWGTPQDEVSYADMEDLARAHAKPGWQKIEGACSAAREGGLEWLWADIICIDKTSSAELSEAINSMYTWYRDADSCYAYLNDVEDHEEPAAADSTFRRSRWFKRGWTLQELIAPRVVEFFSRNWTSIGTRTELAPVIEEVTRIDATILRSNDISAVSIAQRLSWAAGRETTRPEDRAYSLMGLFGVHMPVIYGEGSENAFRRLQLEIIQQRHVRYNIFSRNIRCGPTNASDPSVTLIGRRRQAWSGYSAVDQRVTIMTAIKASRRSLRWAR